MKPVALPACLLSLVLAKPGLSEEAKPPRSVEELKQSIERVLEEHQTPGAAVALVSRDEILWASGIGKADVAAQKDVTPETLLRVGSISKSFVSVSVLMLQERGVLSLEDKVRDLAPEIEFSNPWEDTVPLRLVHLLEHTTGFDDIHLREHAHNDPNPIGLREGLAYNPKSRTSRWKPGTHFSYCNAGPAAAAYIVEKETGKRFEDFVQENILDPLEMTTASFFLTTDVERSLAKGYSSDGKTEAPYWHILVRPSGALNASAPEMAHFVQMLLNRGSFRGRQLLSPASVDRMETPTSTLAAKAGLAAGYGLGNYTDAESGLVFHGHDGGVNAYAASYGYLPDAGLGYVFMINTTNGEAFEAVRKLVQGYLTRDLEKPSPPTPSMPPERIASHTGYYVLQTPRAEMSRFLLRITGVVRVGLKDGNLYLDTLFAEPETILPVSEGQFRKKNEPSATIVFLEDQGTRWLVHRPGSFRAVSTLQVWLQRTLAGAALVLMASSLIFALVWIPRGLLGRLRGRRHLGVRVVPLISVLCLAGASALIILSGDDMLLRFGTRTLWSYSFYLLTLAFAATAVAGLFISWRGQGKNIHRAVRTHSLLVSAANTLVAVYLAYWGIIGLKTWE